MSNHETQEHLLPPGSDHCLEHAGSSLGWAAAPISCLWSCQKEKKGWWGGGGSDAVWVMGGMRVRGVPRHPLHQQCASAGLPCSTRGRTVATNGQSPGELLFTATLSVLKINTKYSYLADPTPAKSCCGPDCAAAAVPAGSSGAFRKTLKHKNMSCCCFLRKGSIWGELLAF